MQHSYSTIAVSGWLDSALNSSVGGWVRGGQDLLEAVLFLVDPCGEGVGSRMRRATIARVPRKEVVGAKSFVFDELDRSIIMRLAVGEAWIEAIGFSDSQAEEFIEDLGSFDQNESGQAGWLEMNEELTLPVDRVPPFVGFRRKVIERLAEDAGVVNDLSMIAEDIGKLSPASFPAELVFDTKTSMAVGAGTSRFEFPVGLVSRDQSSIVGMDGHLFLFEGNNYLMQQYADNDHARNAARAWRKIVRRRKALCDEIDALFLQIIIPEKTSVLPHLFPGFVDAPTYSLRHFRDSTADLPFVLDLLPQIEADPLRGDFYRRIDAHFSFGGCQRAFQFIMEKLGFSDFDPVELGVKRVLGGDIGGRFPGVVETLLAPDRNARHHFQPEESFREIPPDNRHEGLTVRFRNPNAPIKKKVIACANSFFALGAEPHELTWWFARWFEEFHFIWSRNLQREHIIAERPDVVIGQTIERFLPVVPVE